METIAGHNRSMQCWRLARNGQTMFGFADLVPMRAHVRLPWIMGYDLYPVETLDAKKKLLPQASREQWICMFYHDPDEPLCRLQQGEKEFSPIPYREEDQSDIHEYSSGRHHRWQRSLPDARVDRD